MQCVILAAGAGTRISSLAPSKPMLMLYNTPIIEIIIHNVYQAGIKDFVVITGKNHNSVSIHLEYIAKKMNISIRNVYNNRWKDKANGYSALLAEKYMASSFFLLMSDHIFAPAIITDMIDFHHKNKINEGILLGVDFNIRAFSGDIDDATKVLVTEEKINNIGKNLDIFNGIDTGIFLCNRNLFKALDYCNKNNRTSLTDAMLYTSGNKMLNSYDIGNYFWADIDTAEDFKRIQKDCKYI